MAIPLPTLEVLESLAIASPCTVPWDEMGGDERARFCGQCQQQVYDLSMMTTAEVAELLENPDRRPCARLYRRPDGQVMTADCPVSLRGRIWQRLRRRATWAASLFAMLFLPACRTATQGLIASDYAGDSRNKVPQSEVSSQPQPQSNAP